MLQRSHKEQLFWTMPKTLIGLQRLANEKVSRGMTFIEDLGEFPKCEDGADKDFMVFMTRNKLVEKLTKVADELEVAMEAVHADAKVLGLAPTGILPTIANVKQVCTDCLPHAATATYLRTLGSKAAQNCSPSLTESIVQVVNFRESKGLQIPSYLHDKMKKLQAAIDSAASTSKQTAAGKKART